LKSITTTTTTMNNAINDAAQEWIRNDTNDETREVVREMMERGRTKGLNEMFGDGSSWLTFGTSGLRAEMGAGPLRMNDLVVTRAARGLCQHLLNTFPIEQLKYRGVVIGFDHRVSVCCAC
jgi:hypothetical protein